MGMFTVCVHVHIDTLTIALKCISHDTLLITDPEQKESEHPDSDLIWNLQLMAQVMIDALNYSNNAHMMHTYSYCLYKV